MTSENNLDKFWSGIFWSIASVIFRLVISIGSSVIFVRYLGDKGYGQIVVLADFVSICIVLVSFGLGVAQTRIIPQLYISKEYGQIKDVTVKLFVFRIVASIITVIAFYLNFDLLKNNLFIGIDNELIKIALMLIIVQMITTCFRGGLEVTYNQKIVSIGDISGLIFRLVLALPVILFNLGILWFFITQLFADIYMMLLYGNTFNRKVWKSIKSAQRSLYHGKIWSVGIISMFILLFGKCLGKEMDTQLLSYRLGEAALSEITIYSICFMLVMRSLSFIGIGVGSVSNLTQAMMSELVKKEDYIGLKRIYNTQLQLYYFISIPLIFGSFVISEKLLIAMYGNLFHSRGIICFLLFLFFGGTVINFANYPLLFSCGMENKIFKIRAIWGGMNALCSFYLARYGAIGVTLATGICLVGIAVFETFLVNKKIGLEIPWAFFVKIIMSSAVMSFVMYLTLHVIPFNSLYWSVVIAILLGVVILYISMRFFKPLYKDSVLDSDVVRGPIKNFLLSISG